MVTDIGPYTVETVAEAESTRYPFQRKGFYAYGYHYEFYYASNKIYWRNSIDGITWSSENDITPGEEIPADGREIAVWLDRHEEPAHHPHIVWASHGGDSPLYYRRATVDENGGLTWDDDWQVAANEVEDASYRNITICVDDDGGYPFIGYNLVVRAEETDSRPRVAASTDRSGGWVPRSGFPKILDETTHDKSWVCVVVPYATDNIMAVYARNSTEIKYRTYDISEDSWTAEAGVGHAIGADSKRISVTSQRPGKNAVQDPRRVHIAFCYTDDTLNYLSIDDGGITVPILIYSSSTPMFPSISTKIYGHYPNNFRTLYVFWTPIDDSPTKDWVCYKKSTDDGANWVKEDGSEGYELWMDETDADLSGVDIASSYFEEQPHWVSLGDTLPETYIGVLYTNKGASPDYVRWAGLKFTDPDEELLGKFVVRQGISRELLAKAEIGQDSQDLLGKGEIQQSALAELLGEFNAQVSSNLLGKADIRQETSANLDAKFDVGQDSQDLLGKVDITHSVELFSKFIVRHMGIPVELLGKCDIRQIGAPRELLGKFVVRQVGTPVELLGKFIARHETDMELLAKFVVRHTIPVLDAPELYCRFRTSTPDWIIQGVSVEAYISLKVVV